MAAVASEEREQVALQLTWRYPQDAARYPAKTTRCDYAVEESAVVRRICGFKKIGKRCGETAKACASEYPEERDWHRSMMCTVFAWNGEG